MVEVQRAVEPPDDPDRVLDRRDVEGLERRLRHRLGTRDDVRHAGHEHDRSDHGDGDDQPAAAAGRGARDDALDGRRTDVDRPRRLVARGVEGAQVEGLRRLGEPAADLDGRFAQDLADLARVQLAEVPQHDGDTRGLIHPAEPVDDPLQQRELLLELLGQHPARGYRLALTLCPGAAVPDPRVEHGARQLDVDVALAAQPGPVGQDLGERGHGQLVGPIRRHAEHDEHPDDRCPARDQVRRVVGVRAHAPILPRGRSAQ